MTHETPGNVDLLQLRAEVEAELAGYIYEVPDGSIGTPWSAQRVADGLSEMREALVDPYWINVEVRDTMQQLNTKDPPLRDCIAVADDKKGIILLFDPLEASFVLAQRDSQGVSTIGVRGDAVGCFLAR
jgi:hypothetical protein